MGSITGAVPLIYRQQSHHEFVDAVRPNAILVKLHHARRYVNEDGVSAADVFPEETTVITTSTINDATGAYITWEDELRLLKAFQPDAHVPVDYPTYRSTDDEKLQQYVEKMAEGLVKLIHELDDARDEFPDNRPPELLPLGRKYIPENDASTASIPSPVDVGDGLGLTQYTFYATQYYADGGDFRTRILDELHRVIRVLPDDASVFVIGAMSPRLVELLPPEVDAVAGQNAWREVADPKEHSPSEMRAAYQEFATTVNAHLDVTAQASLHPDAPRKDVTIQPPTIRRLEEYAFTSPDGGD